MVLGWGLNLGIPEWDEMVVVWCGVVKDPFFSLFFWDGVGIDE